MIKYLVAVDKELHAALPMLANAAGAALVQEEVDRLFDENCARVLGPRVYHLCMSPSASMRAMAKELWPSSVWLIVSGTDKIEAACERLMLSLHVQEIAHVPRRGAFRFTLKGLFLTTALAAVPLWWIAVQLQWVRQRHE